LCRMQFQTAANQKLFDDYKTLCGGRTEKNCRYHAEPKIFLACAALCVRKGGCLNGKKEYIGVKEYFRGV
ncbi:MAG: hypothetical protein KBS52_03880, partial [Clostridiales bacterium]|nr:hypothetical protein [Candidatus Equinaster intestinalis]